MLRGLAAGTVAIAHLAFAFADHIGPGLGVHRGNGLAGQAGAVRLFRMRRCVRILPSWRISSLPLALVFA